MKFKLVASSSLLILLTIGIFEVRVSALVQANAPTKAPAVEFITAEELKAKIGRGEPVTIIDVRSAGSDGRIKGALNVKLRKLKSRLALAPLSNLSRESEVVTYCACPADESSKRAAQILLGAGFKRVRALKDGWRAWLKANGQVEASPKPA